LSGLLRRTLRAARIVVADRSIPRPIRWIGALALLPIPGPFDEAVLLALAPVLLLFFRRQMRDAWQAAQR
jgi:hypothetical protein